MSGAPALADLQPGDPVRVVEHDDATRQPRPGGLVFAAKVATVTPTYVNIRYNDPAATGRATDVFWKDSLWRAWDGEFRWRLEPATSPVRG